MAYPSVPKGSCQRVSTTKNHNVEGSEKERRPALFPGPTSGSGQCRDGGTRANTAGSGS